jgi:ribosome-associated protein
MGEITQAVKIPLTPEELVGLATRILAAHKGQDLVILNVRGLCGYADYFLICSGGSRRHVLALAQHLQEDLSRDGVRPLGVEGLEEGQWVLLDYNDIIIHLFIKPLREFYDLEGLWLEAGRLTAADFLPPEKQISSQSHPVEGS